LTVLNEHPARSGYPVRFEERRDGEEGGNSASTPWAHTGVSGGCSNALRIRPEHPDALQSMQFEWEAGFSG